MLMPTTGPGTAAGPNHPLALRIGIIAFLNQAITTGSAWASFSVLLGANEARLGISRAQSTLAVPAMLLVIACTAPVVGMLATRYPMRRVSVAGAVLSVAGFLVLALTRSYPLYLIGYGVVLGPGLAVSSIMPSTLVTRWFTARRGLALGLVNIPVVFTVMPLIATHTLHAYGLPATYLILAALAVVTLLANLLITDPPAPAAAPDTATAGSGTAAPAASPATPTVIGLGDLLRTPRFWVLAIAANASTAGSIVITAHIVPMATSWGDSPAAAATLLSIFSLVAMGGTFFFGWLADRLGGASTLALLLLGSAVLWLVLLTQPPFAALAVLIGLLGFFAVGAGPVLGLSLSQAFGTVNFSRAYGMASLVALPFTVIAAPVAGLIYTRSGSYAAVIAVEVGFLLIMFLVLLTVRRGPAPAASGTLGAV